MSHPANGTPRPPRLYASGPTGVKVFDAAPVIVGRDRNAGIPIAHEDVSRLHLELRRSGEHWYAVDSGSTNGTFIDGRRITHEQLPAGRQVVLRVGGVNGPEVALQVEAVPQPQAPQPPLQPQPPRQPQAPQQAPQQPPRQPRQPQPPNSSGTGPLPTILPGQVAHGETILPDRPMGQVITIGRTRGSDVVLDDPLVSRQHATLETGTRPVLRDLNSFNGTYVNGRRITGAVGLNVGDEVVFGNQSFAWNGVNLVSRASRSDLTLFVEHISAELKNGRRLIDDVSFALEPNTLTAVIGPSGAGKSTLLGALTGSMPATAGTVIWQGHDLYSEYEQLRFQIGLVPQQDIQHPQLTVRQGLSYAAELRLPPDTEKHERIERVQHVVGQMQLEKQIDNRIGTQLSGGQKKRVSIATELLTAPPLLFLDEPTSGLDPGLDRDVMHLLRGLSDEGRVVMVVTHSVLALDVCDNILVMAPGGRVAYFGPPQGVLEHFGCKDYPEVFDLLDEPDLWERIPRPRGTEDTGSLVTPGGQVAPPVHQSRGRQLSTLIRRNLAVTMSDRLLLTMLLLMPLVLGALSRVVQGDDGLSILRTGRAIPLPGGELVERYSSVEATQRLTILIVAAALMGTAVTIRELVKERAVFRREYAVGLSSSMYLASKVAVLGVACFGQGVLVTFLATVGLPGPDGGGALGLGWLEVAVPIGALTMAMAVMGLLISALVTSNEQTMPALVGVVMIQLVLSGALVNVHGRPVLEQVSWLAPARWAYAAIASSVDLNKPLEAIAPDEMDPLFTSGAGHWLLAMLLVAVLGAVTLAAAFWAVRRSATATR